MSHLDLDAQRELLARMRVGWDYIASERSLALANVITKDSIGAFETSFAYSQTLPPRTESGFVEFYRLLGRESGRCSI